MKITRKELRRVIAEAVLNEDAVRIHTVKEGETLSEIYESYIGKPLSSDQVNQLVQMQNGHAGVRTGELTRIKSADSIKPEDKILIPGEQAAAVIGAI